MDITLIAIAGSSTVIIGGIVFAVQKIQDNLNILSETNTKTLIDEIGKLSLHIEKKQLNNLNIIQESISNQTKIISQNMNQLEVNTNKSIENIFKKIDTNTILQNEQLDSSVKDLLKSITLSNKELTTHTEDNHDKMISIFKKSEDTIYKLIDTTNSNLENSLNGIKASNSNLKLDFEKYQINNTTQLENSFQNTVSLVNNLRLDNLINVSNEIGKYKNGVVEDEYFLQEVGSCKIIKFTDKQTTEVTEVHYDENGEKSYTQTFLDDNLRYQMTYEKGIISHGVEYNRNNQEIFSYTYDDAGEVSTKIEYIYDESGNQTEKSKIEY